MPLDYASAPYEEQGPTLLARQPVFGVTDQVKGKDWPDIYAHLEQRLASLRTWRWSWWTLPSRRP